MLLHFWYLTLLWFLLLWVSYKMYNGIKFDLSSTAGKRGGWLFQCVLFVASLAVVAIGGRGGLQLKPIGIINAGFYTAPQNMPLVLNTPFAVITTFGKQELHEMEYFDESELSKFFSPIHGYRLFQDSVSNENNVVIIILESFSSEYTGFFNPNSRGYTPFLDSLAVNGLSFINCFANGKKSVEAIPAIVAGLPTLMDNPYITSIYAGNKVEGLATHLKKIGYSTSFYHGGNNGTMGFDAFAKVSGFEKYYGRSEYNNDKDYDGKWGIYDEEFYTYFANGLNNTKQPFLSCFVSLSSHHPYSVPEKYKDKFDKGELPIHESIGYADYALRKFFETVSEMSWFDNTLFVITADHTEKPLSDYFSTRVGIYDIPLIFYKSGGDFKSIMDRTAQQTDIMPSVLNYLGYREDFLAFGNSVFREHAGAWSVSFLNEIYQIIQGGNALQFDGEKTTGLYKIETDTLLKNNLMEKEPELVLSMEIQLKAIIQSYNYRLINNQLTTD